MAAHDQVRNIGDDEGPVGAACTPDLYYSCGPDNDPYWDNVVLLLHMDADFSDSSSYAHAPTVTGNAAISATAPKFGAGCGTFDGSGDRVSYAHADLALGAGDFTIECWVKVNTLSSSQKGILGNNSGSPYWFLGKNTVNKLFFTQFGGGSVTLANDAAIAGTWYHVAVVRSGTTIRMYINGTMQTATGPFTETTNYTAPTTLYAGSYSTTEGDAFDGQLDDVRITKGVARYTGNFTIPAEAFPDAEETVWSPTDPRTTLLVHADEISEKLVGHFPLTSDYFDVISPGSLIEVSDTGALAFGVGGAEWVPSSTNRSYRVTPFTSQPKWSTWNATGNYGFRATVTLTTDASTSGPEEGCRFLTVYSFAALQFGFSYTMVGNSKRLVYYANTDGFPYSGKIVGTYQEIPDSSTVSYQLEVKHNAGVITWYVDGVLVRTKSEPRPTLVGVNFGPVNANWKGCTNLKILDLRCFHTSDLPDYSCYQPKQVYATEGAVVSSTEKQFGAGSLLVPNVGTSTTNGAVITDHMDFDHGTGDFTLELWAYRIANTYVGTLYYATLGGGEFSVKVGTDGLIDLIYRSSGGSQTISNVGTWTIGTWLHFVTQRRGTHWETYLHGVLINSTAITGGASSTVNHTGDFFIGRTNASSAQSWNGYIDEWRFTKGVARYSDPFTPAAMAFCEGTTSGPVIDYNTTIKGALLSLSQGSISSAVYTPPPSFALSGNNTLRNVYHTVGDNNGWSEWTINADGTISYESAATGFIAVAASWGGPVTPGVGQHYTYRIYSTTQNINNYFDVLLAGFTLSTSLGPKREFPSNRLRFENVGESAILFTNFSILVEAKDTHPLGAIGGGTALITLGTNFYCSQPPAQPNPPVLRTLVDIIVAAGASLPNNLNDKLYVIFQSDGKVVAWRPQDLYDGGTALHIDNWITNAYAGIGAEYEIRFEPQPANILTYGNFPYATGAFGSLQHQQLIYHFTPGGVASTIVTGPGCWLSFPYNDGASRNQSVQVTIRKRDQSAGVVSVTYTIQLSGYRNVL